MAYAEVVPSALSGERIDRVVAMITGVSRTRVTEWLEQGLVLCNDDVITTRSRRVVEGDSVVINVDPDLGPAPLVAEPGIDIPIVYADDDVIVVNKPAGLVVHPGAGNATGTLVQAMLALYPEIASIGEPERPGVVHRLDKDTSGLMLMARSAEGYSELSAMLSAHEVERTYLTLVWGIPEAGSGLIDAPIGRSTREPTKMVVSAQGRDARTRYTVLETFEAPVPCALVECRLETGRTHQIRVHMAAIGHGVVGDDRYRGVRSVIETPRIFLHSAALEFDHPVRLDERLEFVAELPDDLAEVLDRLRNQTPTAE
jgi:23S rRNA pseudouridine1911/1915/1917 synthase